MTDETINQTPTGETGDLRRGHRGLAEILTEAGTPTSPRQAKHMLRNGLVPHRRIGGRYIVSRSTVLGYLRGEIEWAPPAKQKQAS